MDSLEGFVSYDYLVRDILRQRGVEVDEVSWRDPHAIWDHIQARRDSISVGLISNRVLSSLMCWPESTQPREPSESAQGRAMECGENLST